MMCSCAGCVRVRVFSCLLGLHWLPFDALYPHPMQSCYSFVCGLCWRCLSCVCLCSRSALWHPRVRFAFRSGVVLVSAFQHLHSRPAMTWMHLHSRHIAFAVSLRLARRLVSRPFIIYINYKMKAWKMDRQARAAQPGLTVPRSRRRRQKVSV